MLIVGWFIIRRDLRPLEQMTGTAERISAGDLSQRVGVDADARPRLAGSGTRSTRCSTRSRPRSSRSVPRSWPRSAARTQLRQFVADASHELRTPLTAVRGYAELYRAGGLAEDEALDQAMARIGTESRRMAALVEDLLLLARLDQGGRSGRTRSCCPIWSTTR